MRPVLVVALLATVALAGCFEPYRVHVPAATLEASGLDWNVTKGAVHGSTFKTKTTETRYVHTPTSDPPYPGVLQVFSIRGGARSLDDLIDVAHDILEDAVAREGIVVNQDLDSEGARTLKSGVKTVWFSHEGRIPSASSDSILFTGGDDLIVRVLGEVGYDGKSKTALVLFTFVQVGTHSDPGLPGGIGGGEAKDLRTWHEIVGDNKGTVDGATVTGDRGLIWNLRSHG